MNTLKKILNSLEAETSNQLDETLERHDARAFAKVRAADVLPIEGSGLSGQDYSFALRAHFDFVVANQEYQPLFAVEFDGPSHMTIAQTARDIRKDSLCDRFDLPILRVNANHLKERYRGLNLLAWFIEVWFAAKEFERRQADGVIPYDEPFDPTFFSTIPGHDRSFPLMLSAGANARMRKLWLQGKVHDFGPSFIVGRDVGRTFRALGWLMVSEDAGVLAQTAMRAQRFPAREWEALREIVQCQVERQLSRVLEGNGRLLSKEHIAEERRLFRERNSLVHSLG